MNFPHSLPDSHYNWILLSFATHVSGVVHVGQAVQGKDVALLPVLVDLDERLFGCSQRPWVLAGALHPAIPLHWRGTDAHAPQRQQQRQQRTVLHGQAAGRDAERKRWRSFIIPNRLALASVWCRVNITIAPQTPHASKAHVSEIAASVVSTHKPVSCHGQLHNRSYQSGDSHRCSGRQLRLGLQLNQGWLDLKGNRMMSIYHTDNEVVKGLGYYILMKCIDRMGLKTALVTSQSSSAFSKGSDLEIPHETPPQILF